MTDIEKLKQENARLEAELQRLAPKCAGERAGLPEAKATPHRWVNAQVTTDPEAKASQFKWATDQLVAKVAETEGYAAAYLRAQQAEAQVEDLKKLLTIAEARINELKVTLQKETAYGKDLLQRYNTVLNERVKTQPPPSTVNANMVSFIENRLHPSRLLIAALYASTGVFDQQEALDAADGLIQKEKETAK